MGRAVVVACLLATVALSGCFDPYRAHVPAEVLGASPLVWNVTNLPQHGGNFGDKTVETRYVHIPEDDGPPYPGVLQVFSIRGGAVADADRLIEFTRTLVDDAAAREGISIDGTQAKDGERRLASGLKTQWFSHLGRIEQTSDESLFLPQDGNDLVVRILGEAAYDGKSKTGLVVVAFVQVGTHTDSSLPGVLPATQQQDERTWFEVVADTTGHIGGATLPDGRGLITNLRTHG